MSFSKDDQVMFGRPNGEQTLGLVLKVNRKTILVKQLESRGTKKNHEAGKKWKVDKTLARLAFQDEIVDLDESDVEVDSVKVGDRFFYIYADGNCEWEVTRKFGRGWEAAIVPEDEYAGATQVFKESQILLFKRQAAADEKSAKSQEEFYADLEPGDIVYVHNSFDSFVKMEAVQNGKGVKLKAIGLIGDWSRDKPSRSKTGEIYYPYHWKKIMSGELSEPNFSNIVGSAAYSRKKVDLDSLPVVDLTVPPLTAEEERQAALYRFIQDIKDFDDIDPAEWLHHAADFAQKAFENDEDMKIQEKSDKVSDSAV